MIRPDLPHPLAVADALDAARTRLRAGWCQGAPGRDADGRPLRPDEIGRARALCLSFAIDAAARAARIDVRTCVEVVEHAVGGRSVSLWNDAPGRTRAEAAGALTRAASGLRRRGWPAGMVEP